MIGVAKPALRNPLYAKKTSDLFKLLVSIEVPYRARLSNSQQSESRVLIVFVHRKVSKWDTCHKPPFSKGGLEGL